MLSKVLTIHTVFSAAAEDPMDLEKACLQSWVCLAQQERVFDHDEAHNAFGNHKSSVLAVLQGRYLRVLHDRLQA